MKSILRKFSWKWFHGKISEHSVIYLRNILLLKASFHNSHVLPICSDRRALVLLQNTEYIPVNHAYICLHYCNTYYFLFASVLRVHSPNTIDVLLLQGQPKQNVVFINCPIFIKIIFVFVHWGNVAIALSDLENDTLSWVTLYYLYIIPM